MPLRGDRYASEFGLLRYNLALRIILLILLFLIWNESATPATAHWQRVDAPLGAMIFIGGYLLLIAITRWCGGRLAKGMVNGDPGRAVDRFNWMMTGARMLIPTWFGVGVFLLGWRSLVDRLMGPIASWQLETPGAILGLIPGFVGWMGLWWSQFPVDRALREHNVLHELESDLPVFSAPAFRGYFLNKLRVQLLFTIVPLLTILVLRDVVIVALHGLSMTDTGRRWGLTFPVSDSLDAGISFAAVVVVLLVSPELLRYVLHTQRLPASELRDSLSGLCDDAGVRCREILLWRTQNNLGNAAVMGLFPFVRYVMLSDLLLESMTDQQIRAVFAHELGHVKHRHLIWFVLFFITVGTCLFGLAALLENQLPLGEDAKSVFDIASLVLCGAALFTSYGFLSRWFERQADVYAARTMEKPLLEQGNPQGLGAAVFASALERVAIVNNIPMNARNWTHGSIAARVRYIHRLGRDPVVAQRFDRTGRIVFVGLVVLIVVCGGFGTYLAFR